MENGAFSAFRKALNEVIDKDPFFGGILVKIRNAYEE
jgi:hypothetical protein